MIAYDKSSAQQVQLDTNILIYSGGGPIHAHVPIHAHPWIYPKPRRLHTKLPMYMINLITIYDMVNMFCMKKYKSLRKLRVGVNSYMGVNWSTTTKSLDIFTRETASGELYHIPLREIVPEGNCLRNCNVNGPLYTTHNFIHIFYLHTFSCPCHRC